MKKSGAAFKPFGKLILSISGGATPLKSDKKQYASEGIKLLRIQNISEHGLILDDLAFISPEVHNGLLARSQLKANDLLMTITGRIGTALIVESDQLPANINQHIVRIRLTESEVQREFVKEYLNTDIGKLFSNRGVTGTTRIALDYEAIRSIPVFYPSLRSVQLEMVEEIANARKSHLHKLEQADALLNNLNAYLLSHLNLVNSKSSFPRFYAANLKDIRARCDPDFHSPKFKDLRRAIEISHYPIYNLNTLAPNPRTGFAAGREVQSFNELEGIPHVRPLNITKYGELTFEGTKLVPRISLKSIDKLQPDEVLLNNTNSTEWVGKSTVFEGQRECSCSNHITRLTPNRSLVLPWFLAALLNAIRSTGYLGLLATNFVNQAGINTETLGAIRLPIPSLPEQQEIVNELMNRRRKASLLRKEAAQEWEMVKAHFEAQLLSEGTGQ